MKRIGMLISLVCLLIGCQGEADNQFNVLKVPTDNINQYQYTISLDTEEKSYSGNLLLTLTNDTDDDWKELYFRDYSSYFEKKSEISHALINGQEANISMNHDPTIFSITLDNALEPKQTIQVSFDFKCYLPNTASRFGYFQENDDIYYNLGNALPILSVYENGQWVNEPYSEVGECFYSKIAAYQVDLKVPKGYIAAGSGEETIKEDEDFDIYHYEAQGVRDIALSISNHYFKLEENYDGIMIKSYASQEADAITMLENAKSGLKNIHERLPRYPYQTICLVLTPLNVGGMEYPQLVMINERLKDTKTTIVHELVHQWFYGIVGNNQFQSAWLDESLASYIATPDRTVQYFEPISKSINEYEDIVQYTDAVYYRGNRMFCEIEETYGKEQLNEVLREYVSQYCFKEAKTEDLVELLRKRLGQDVDNILEKYIETKYLGS